MKTTEELKNLLYKNETVADAAPDAIAAAQDFCEGYKTFLDNAKTEREATAYSEKLLTAAGYQKFVPGTSNAPGTKVYTNNREKCVLAATNGTKARKPMVCSSSCEALTSSVRSPPGSGVSEKRMVSPIPSCKSTPSAAEEAMRPFEPIPASVRPRWMA